LNFRVKKFCLDPQVFGLFGLGHWSVGFHELQKCYIEIVIFVTQMNSIYICYLPKPNHLDHHRCFQFVDKPQLLCLFFNWNIKIVSKSESNFQDFYLCYLTFWNQNSFHFVDSFSFFLQLIRHIIISCFWKKSLFSIIGQKYFFLNWFLLAFCRLPQTLRRSHCFHKSLPFQFYFQI